MKDIVIVGASGFGMEVLWLCKRLGRNVLGFLDDTVEKQSSKVMGHKILGPINTWDQYSNCDFVIAVGSPRGRLSIEQKMKIKGEPHFCTLIDPSAIVDKEVSIGEGSIICAGVICTVMISIGRHVIVNLNSTIGHETKIDDFCTIAPNVSVSGNVHLMRLSEVGTGSHIREKMTVGEGSILGMGGVLVKDLANYTVAVGNPAKELKKIES